MMQLDYMTASRYLWMYHHVQSHFPISLLDRDLMRDRFLHSISPNEVQSKLWLLEQLFPKAVFMESQQYEILNASFGWPLVDLLLKQYTDATVTLYDTDGRACAVAREYIRLWGVGDRVQVMNRPYTQRYAQPVDCVIQCSAETMTERMSDYDYGDSKPLFAVQSCNVDTVNGISDERALLDHHGFDEVYFTGSKSESGNNFHKRFMVIGRYKK